MPEDNESEVKERLDVLIALTTGQIKKETEPRHLLAALSKMGISRPTIARVLGSTPDAVRMALKRTGRGARRSPATPKRARGKGR